jgi:hypothetical protein
MNRTQWTLAGTLVVQLALIVAVTAWSRPTAAVAPHALFPALASFTPSKVEVVEGKDKSVDLERTGNGWALGAENGYPVDASKLNGLLAKLKDLQVRAPVVSSSRYHAALKVSDDSCERRVRVWDAGGGDPKVDLLVGTSPRYGVSHVRAEGQDAVYEASGLATYDLRTDASAWVDTAFVNVPFDEVTGVKLRNAKGDFEIEKSGDDWVSVPPSAAHGRKLDRTKAESFVRSLSSLRLSDPAGPSTEPSYGFTEPAAVVEIAYKASPPKGDEAAPPDAKSGAENRTVRIVLGSEVDASSGKRYVSRAGFDHAAIVAKSDAEAIAGKSLSDLLESTR